MKRKISRQEKKDTIINLIDLGFSVATVASMLNMTTVGVYGQLKSAKRMAKREVIRQRPTEVHPVAMSAMRKVFANPEPNALSMLALSMSREEE